MKLPRFLTVPLLVPVFFLCALTLSDPDLTLAEETAAASSPGRHCGPFGWPQDSSDLQPDPALLFGQLPNGLRYVLMSNREPRDRVALYLNVQAGSLHETEEQRGVAHFLEHMLFNGTTHYPPGTLVKYFQSQGMGFGGDTNARTGFGETVYNLLLPTGDGRVLAEGFKVLADYARGALLLEEEVERERGVILAEKRTRDSAAARVSKDQLRFDFAGTLAAQRDPIGTEEVLLRADSRLLRTFYNEWYRPENMIVVVVGEIDPRQTVRLLTEAMAGLRAEGEAGICPEMGTVKEDGTETLVLLEPELGYTALALTTVFNHLPRPDTLAWELEQLRQYVAVSLLTNRLRQLEQQPGSPLAQSRAYAGFLLRRYGYATLTARVEQNRWRDGVTMVQTALRQVLKEGFSEAELARGKKEITALLEKAVQTAPSRDSRQLAEDIIRKTNNNEVILSPDQEMELYRPALQAMTLAEVNGAVRELWKHPRRLVELVGVVEPGLQSARAGQQLEELYLANEAKPVPAWQAPQSAPFPYLKMPATSAEVISRHHIKAIGVDQVRLGNGISLNIKSTGFQANQLLLSAQFGQGRLSEPADGLALVSESFIRESGVGKLTREQLTEALAGTNVMLDFKVGPESFFFNGAGLRQELTVLLQLLRHHLQDPAFSPETFRRSRESLRRMYDQLNGSVEGVFQIQGERFFCDTSKECGLPAWEQIEKVHLPQIRKWLEPAFQREALEINVVGDIDPEEVIRQVALIFGADRRTAGKTVSVPAPVFPAGKQEDLSAASSTDKAMLSIAWKTADFWDIGRTRRLNLLAAVLDDRLREQIRENLGATYAPRVVSLPGRACAGFGVMKSSMIVAPQEAEKLAGVIKETAADLGGKGVSNDELRRALEPMLTSIKDIKRNNRYWLESVLNLSGRHPQQLEWPLTISEDFAAIRADELTALARQYLNADQAATVIVRPLQPSAE
ncbi:MAG: insulinase family protein [Desulfobulbus sp.]|nr:insulinase family protein [Desulfobulbus sp.]